MTEYLIAFNDEWVPDHTDEELRAKADTVRSLVAEMKAAGVLIFTGGLDDAAPVVSVEPSNGKPVFTDGPFVETKEVLGGFAVVDVADEEAARLVGRQDRDRLRLATGAATLPDADAADPVAQLGVHRLRPEPGAPCSSTSADQPRAAGSRSRRRRRERY